MRNYKRKSNRKLCSEEKLVAARAYIEDGHSIRTTADMLGLHESTLRKRLKAGHGAEQFGRFRSVFTPQMEEMLVQHCKDLDERFYGLSFKTLQMIAYDFAALNHVAHPFDNEKKMAGKDWAYKFIQKYNLSLRTPSGTSLARVMGFNKIQVEVFFNNLSTLYNKFKFPPSAIYNMDESSISTVPNKIPKVISPKGKKLVGKVTSAERGETITVVCAMSASGSFVPPAIVFPRKRMKIELMDGSPSESIGMCSDSGYMNKELFLDWLKHFHAKVRPDKEHPVLLILDNHSSHRSLEAVLFCRQNAIHLLTIPPHSSHRLQPLDRCYFKSLKTFYADECDQWLTSNPGRQINHFQMARLFGQAYRRYSTIEKGIKSFEKCGIYPINKFVFSEEDFLPSSVTDNNTNLDNQGVNNNDSDPEFDVPLANLKNLGLCTPEKQVSSSAHAISRPPPPTKNISLGSDNQWLDKIYPPSTSRDPPKIVTVSPKKILPLPKKQETQKRKSKGQKSEILSSTPFKDKLEEEEKEKRRKEEVKSTKNIKRKIVSIKEKSKTRVATEVKSSHSIEKKKSKRKESSNEKYFCHGCSEEYEDPPIEDWIQCMQCDNWWHENCTGYERVGQFICDACV